MKPASENSSQPTSQPRQVQPPGRELTPEERALLPDFNDEARIGQHIPAVNAPPDSNAERGDRNVMLGGVLGGCFGNIVLGFILLSFQRMGLTIFGPAVVAIVLGLLLLFLLAREWPRRVMLGVAAFGISLLLSYALLYLFIRPALSSLNPDTLSNVPPVSTSNS